MFKRNFVRHFVLLVFSLGILYVFTGFVNKNYYTTISRVNDVEINEIESLLRYILEGDSTIDFEKLKSSLEGARFLKIEIIDSQKVVVSKELGRGVFDPFSEKSFFIGKYTVNFYKRQYPAPVDDYLFYIKSIKSFFTGNNPFGNTLFNLLLLNNAVIFLFLELIVTVISAKYRISMVDRG